MTDSMKLPEGVNYNLKNVAIDRFKALVPASQYVQSSISRYNAQKMAKICQSCPSGDFVLHVPSSTTYI